MPIMKRLFYIFISATLLTCSSCSDFLEKYPQDSPNVNMPVSDELAIAMTNGCYQSLQSMNLYNQRIWTLDICAGNSEVGGDPSTGTDGVETKEIANFYATPTNNLAIGVWRGGYTGIGNCNTTNTQKAVNFIPADIVLKIFCFLTRAITPHHLLNLWHLLYIPHPQRLHVTRIPKMREQL